MTTKCKKCNRIGSTPILPIENEGNVRCLCGGEPELMSYIGRIEGIDYYNHVRTKTRWYNKQGTTQFIKIKT